jgi:hypothetical protein
VTTETRSSWVTDPVGHPVIKEIKEMRKLIVEIPREKNEENVI